MTIELDVETYADGSVFDVTIDGESENSLSLQLSDPDDVGNLVWYLLHCIAPLEEENLRLAQQLKKTKWELDFAKNPPPPLDIIEPLSKKK